LVTFRFITITVGDAMLDQKNFLIVGLTRNSERYIESELMHLESIFADFGQVSFHLVESDSSDNTLEILSSLAASKPNLTFTSMGNLESTISVRTERMRVCRNEYVKWIRTTTSRLNFVVVVDFDGMNKKLSKSGVKSSLNREALWSACFPNQLFGYYDLYALRCKGWVERDFLPTLRSQIKKTDSPSSGTLLTSLTSYMREDTVRRRLIYRNMRILFPWGPLIYVESAFGALGIYKAECFLESDYGSPRAEYTECEHVHFHAKLFSSGKQLVINPRMLNSWVNPYNLNKIFFVRVLRRVKTLVRGAFE